MEACTLLLVVTVVVDPDDVVEVFWAMVFVIAVTVFFIPLTILLTVFTTLLELLAEELLLE